MWRLRPLIFFSCVIARGPPLSVVFTDWLSITPAVGLASQASRLARRHNERVVQRGKGFRCATTRRNSPEPWSRVENPSAIVAIGSRWMQCRGSRSPMLASLFRADARGLREAEEAAPSQAIRHPSYRFSYRMPSRLYCGRVILVQTIVLSFESIQSEGITNWLKSLSFFLSQTLRRKNNNRSNCSIALWCRTAILRVTVARLNLDR